MRFRIQAVLLHSFVNLLDYGLHPQAAIDAARLHFEERTLDVDSRPLDFVHNGFAALGLQRVKCKTHGKANSDVLAAHKLCGATSMEG